VEHFAASTRIAGELCERTAILAMEAVGVVRDIGDLAVVHVTE
jgi:hypothetical protein